MAVHRHKDRVFQIRLEFLSAISDWALTYPEMFATLDHLKYVGMHLNDKVGLSATCWGQPAGSKRTFDWMLFTCVRNWQRK